MYNTDDDYEDLDEFTEDDYYSDVDKDYPCDDCPRRDSCDGWEARFCCVLCEYNGFEDCENCDTWDI